MATAPRKSYDEADAMADLVEVVGRLERLSLRLEEHVSTAPEPPEEGPDERPAP